jgi:putative holliday junction resolvase
MICQNSFDLLNFKAPNSRLLGLDVGTKTIGLALSDTRWIIASPLKTLLRTKMTHDVKELKKILEEFNVAGLVVGLPVNMNGSEGPRCQSVRQFAKDLDHHCETPLCFWDERMSTIAVTRTLLEADVSRKRRIQMVDKMAASFILQGVLDAFQHFSQA